jgi:hypothetical protein
MDPAGIYFGTRSGQLFGSQDEGRTWQKILDGLPAVVCVRSAVFEGDSLPALSKSTPSTTSRSKTISTRKSQAAIPTHKSRPTKKR